ESITAALVLAEPSAEDKLLELADRMRSELAQVGGRRHAGPPRPAMQPAAPRAVAIAAPESNLPAAAQQADGFPHSPPGATDPALAARVGAAIQRSRQRRSPITLALFEVERFSQVLLELGPAGVAEMTHWLRLALTDWTGQRAEAVLVSDSCFAL